MKGSTRVGRRGAVIGGLVLAGFAAGGGAAPATKPVAAPAVDASVTCLIQPSLEVNVGTPVDGVLEIVKADRGDLVRAGQLLARLAAGVEMAAVEHITAKAEFGARKKERNEDLQTKQLISKQEVDEIATEHRLAELELREKREVLNLKTINSPITGVIVDRYKHPGDLVKQEKIFRIAQLDPLHVETVLPAAYFGRIQEGQTYEVGLQVIGKSVQARVVTVDKVIDSASSTFRVRLLLANPRYQIPAGIRCSVRNLPT
jgi:membrane fusion protein (multidrug efflux system)